MRSVRTLKSIFPLNYHPQVLIVQQQNFHREFFTVQRCEFLDVHLKGSIPVDIDDQGPRMCSLNPHRSR